MNKIRTRKLSALLLALTLICSLLPAAALAENTGTDIAWNASYSMLETNTWYVNGLPLADAGYFYVEADAEAAALRSAFLQMCAAVQGAGNDVLTENDDVTFTWTCVTPTGDPLTLVVDTEDCEKGTVVTDDETGLSYYVYFSSTTGTFGLTGWACELIPTVEALGTYTFSVEVTGGNTLRAGNVTVYAVADMNNPTDATSKTIRLSLSGPDGEFLRGAKEGTTDTALLNLLLTVDDLDFDESITIHDAFLALHRAYSENGGADYAAANSPPWGLGVVKFWGLEYADIGYYLNHSYGLLTSPLENGDDLRVFFYQDTEYYGDVYTWFEKDAAALSGAATALTLSYDAGWNGESDPAGAAVKVYNESGAELPALATTVGADGAIAVTFPASGVYTVRARSAAAVKVVPADCTVYVDATVYVTIGDEGVIPQSSAAGKNALMAQAPVIVTDTDGDGTLTVHDALSCLHDAYYAGGASAGYGVAAGQHGPGITKLWGGTTGAYGYYVNDEIAMSLMDPVSHGDYITAYSFVDLTAWSDQYTYFTRHTGSATASSPVTLTLKSMAFDAGWNPVAVAQAAAAIAVYDGSGRLVGGWSAINNGDGGYALTFTAAGTYYVVAGGTEDSGVLVPAACRITVTQGGSSGGNDKITVRVQIKTHSAAACEHGEKPLTLKDNPGAYTNVLSQSVTLAPGSSVFDTVTAVTDNYTEKSSGYLSMLWGLSEGDHGANSGWLYMVDGAAATIGSRGYSLTEDATVVWWFTDDYTNDTGSEQWIGGGGGAAAAKAETEVSVTLTPAATVTNGTASATVTEADLTAAITAARNEKADTVVIAPTGADKAGTLSVTVPTMSATALAKAGLALTVSGAQGALRLPADALTAAATGATTGDSLAITIAAIDAETLSVDALPAGTDLTDALIFQIGITSGGSAITGFGGASVTVTLPVGDGFTVGESYRVYVISADGAVEALPGKVLERDGTRVIDLSLSHLTQFVVMRETFLRFIDVSLGSWYYDAILFAVSRDLLRGVGRDRFAPDDGMTRAMAVTVLYRLSGEAATDDSSGGFSDVEDGMWYTDAVAWATANGITEGYGDGRFGVNDGITRQQLAAMLWRYARYEGRDTAASGDLAAFTDAGTVAPWARDALRWAVAEELLVGTPATSAGYSTLEPEGGASRAQMATILLRFTLS